MRILLTRARALARDRRLSAAHEAGHEVVANYLGYYAKGWIAPTGAEDHVAARTVEGHCDIGVPRNAPLKVKRLIAVAGAVAEVLTLVPDANEYDELLDIHRAMSPADCKLGRLPHHSDVDLEWPERSNPFALSVIAATILLRGPLNDHWRARSHEIRRGLFLD